MRRHVVEHDVRIQTLAGADSHMTMLIENLGLAYAQLVDTMENYMAPPDCPNMPEARSDWQRPPRRSSGLPSEQSYGGCGGCSANF